MDRSNALFVRKSPNGWKSCFCAFSRALAEILTDFFFFFHACGNSYLWIWTGRQSRPSIMPAKPTSKMRVFRVFAHQLAEILMQCLQNARRFYCLCSQIHLRWIARRYVGRLSRTLPKWTNPYPLFAGRVLRILFIGSYVRAIGCWTQKAGDVKFFPKSDHSVLRTFIFHKIRAKPKSKRPLKANSPKTWSDIPKPQALLPRLTTDSFEASHVPGRSAVAAVRGKMLLIVPHLRLWNWRFLRNSLIWSQIWTSWW